ncbi:MAG: alternative ribosome rescue aminoacyl-tRNA hydrolase ArfB [Pseudobdellovibrionaceae bacterium]
MNKNIILSEVEITYARSSGPGGQNVNKVSSACLLRYYPLMSEGLSEVEREKIGRRLQNKLRGEGCLIFKSDKFRDQTMNRKDVIEKLFDLLEKNLIDPKKRIATKPTYSSTQKRRTDKKKHGEKKKQRSNKSWD